MLKPTMSGWKNLCTFAPKKEAVLNIFKGIQINSDTWRTIFRAFIIYPNYRIYYYGQSISLIGVWVQNIAMGWLLYRITGSALMLGTVAFAQQIPSLFLMPLAGVMADRLNRRRVLIYSQIAAMIVAFVLAFVVLADQVTIPMILILATINGIILAFDTPFRHAFVPDMITRKEDLGNAIALNSSLYNLARFIGPPIGGVLIALVGEGWCFFINGVSFLAVIISLIVMKTGKQKVHIRTGSILYELKAGIDYALHDKPIRYLLTLVMLSSFFGLPFQALMPVFAADVLKGGSELLGLLTGALGFGALSGAFYLAARKKMHTIPVSIFRTSLVFAFGLGIFALSPWRSLSFITMAATGFGMIVHFNSTNAIIQTIADEDKRGRVIALYSLSFMGITPLGSLAAGSLSEIIGVPYTVFAFSVVCIGSALLFGKRLPVVYRRLVRKTIADSRSES
jgi:MFS family permease